MVQQSFKCLTNIQYQLMTKHIRSLRKWASPLAFMILNVMEVLTWPVSVVFQFLGIDQVCIGDSCTYQKTAAGLSVAIL